MISILLTLLWVASMLVVLIPQVGQLVYILWLDFQFACQRLKTKIWDNTPQPKQLAIEEESE